MSDVTAEPAFAQSAESHEPSHIGPRLRAQREQLGLSLRRIERPERLHPLALLAPRPLLNQIVARAILAALAHDVRQDIPIWENKRYLERPALAEGDGPVGRFRQWARQFYPAPDAPTAEERATSLAASDS